MAQLRDTNIHGILDAEQYVISKQGYNVAKMHNNSIRFGDENINSYLDGNYIYINPKEGAYMSTESRRFYRSIYVTNAAIGMEISGGYAGTYSSINMTDDGSLAIFSNPNLNNGQNGIQLKGHILISDENYGTEEPANKIDSPRKGFIYFKIVT